MNKRQITIDGVTYEASREALVRDGGPQGGSSHSWYAVVIDEDGAQIDERVPEGGFRLMRDCHKAIRDHVGGPE